MRTAALTTTTHAVAATQRSAGEENDGQRNQERGVTSRLALPAATASSIRSGGATEDEWERQQRAPILPPVRGP